MSAEAWIKQLGLIPQDDPKCGHFKVVSCSDLEVTDPSGRIRKGSSTIYYLQKRGQHSYLHRLVGSDELFFYHSGAPLKVIYLDQDAPNGMVERELGPGPGQHLQLTVPADKYLMQMVPEDAELEYSLGSVVVSPAFDPALSMEGKRSELVNTFPQHKEFIEKYSKN